MVYTLWFAEVWWQMQRGHLDYLFYFYECLKNCEICKNVKNVKKILTEVTLFYNSVFDWWV